MGIEVEHERIVLAVLEAASLPRPARIERIPEGIGNHVYLAGEVVVRLGTGSDAPAFPRAVAVLRAARATVRVPQVVYADCTRDVHPLPVMVLERMPGAPLSRSWPSLDRAGRVRMLEAIAGQLQALHRLTPHDVPDAGFSHPWWQERRDRIDHLLSSLPGTVEFPDAWFRHLARYVDEHHEALVRSPPACVLHNDVHGGNVLVDGGRLTALLDFDDVLAGPAEEDAWALLLCDDDLDPLTDVAAFRDLPGLDLGAPGALPRRRLSDVQDILELLSGELSWVSPRTALADAHETYVHAFECDRYDRLVEALSR